jgi:hypothetical protein
MSRKVWPTATAIGLSWSTSFDAACWFATMRAGFARLLEQRGAQPFVFDLTATADEIIALHEGGTALTATEQEALLEPATRPARVQDSRRGHRPHHC